MTSKEQLIGQPRAEFWSGFLVVFSLRHAVFVAAFLLALAVEGLATVGSSLASRPDARAPSAVERRWVASLMEDLAANSAAMPIPVINASRSLTKTLSWSFACPPGSRLQEIDMLVSTELVRWDPTLAGRHKTAGTYFWELKLYHISGKATVTADNRVMLDPKILEREARKGRAGRFYNQGLLYHELLHGELMILAMSTREWQTQACNGKLDLRHNDQDHRTINPVVERYLEGLSSVADSATAG